MQDPRRNGAASIKEFTAVLPRSAHSLYFRDEIGNVSTSSVKRQRERMEVRLQPRFVLFGGWQVPPVALCLQPLFNNIPVTVTPIKEWKGNKNSATDAGWILYIT